MHDKLAHLLNHNYLFYQNHFLTSLLTFLLPLLTSLTSLTLLLTYLLTVIAELHKSTSPCSGVG